MCGIMSLGIKLFDCIRQNAKTIYSSFIVGAVPGFYLAYIIRKNVDLPLFGGNHDDRYTLIDWLIDILEMPLAVAFFQLMYWVVLFCLLKKYVNNLEPDFEKKQSSKNNREVSNFTDDLKMSNK